jgi:hypothetical protein
MQLCSQHINKLLTLINHSEATLVTPLYKRNGKSQSANYRPISLLAGFSKLSEICFEG